MTLKTSEKRRVVMAMALTNRSSWQCTPEARRRRRDERQQAGLS